jgi:L-lactate dehydrogenase complex protein LldG
MSAARTEILERLRSRQKNPVAISTARQQDCEDHVPPSKQACISRFIENVKKSGATIATLADYTALPSAVASYLEENNLPKQIQLSNHGLNNLDWGDKLATKFGPFDGDNEVGLVEAYAGIAETGTLVSLSSRTLATSALFLPHYSLVVLNAEGIKERMEDIWALIREEQQHLPRTINLITGPSRTGDIEQRIEIGAHGPCELHIILVNCPPRIETGGTSSGEKEKSSG